MNPASPPFTSIDVAFQNNGLNSCPSGTVVNFQLRDAICFPASASVRRLAAGGAWETVALPDVHIGDTVQCLKREPVFGADGGVTSAAYGKLDRCTVYDYKKAAAGTVADYTRVAYEDGSVAMTPNHHLLDPTTGQARQAGTLKAGDSVLRAAPSGGVAAAKVRSVATVREAGAYVPLLTDGGLPIVDGVAAYPSSGESSVGLDAKHWGQYFLSAPVWQSLGKGGVKAASSRSPAHGRSLSDLGASQPVGAYTQRWYDVGAAARHEGRAFYDWAGVAQEMHAAIAQGKVYTEVEALGVLDRHITKALHVTVV